jgi:hypothetical protein
MMNEGFVKFLDIAIFIVFTIGFLFCSIHFSGPSPEEQCNQAGGTYVHVGGVGVAKYNSVCVRNSK